MASDQLISTPKVSEQVLEIEESKNQKKVTEIIQSHPVVSVVELANRSVIFHILLCIPGTFVFMMISASTIKFFVPLVGPCATILGTLFLTCGFFILIRILIKFKLQELNPRHFLECFGQQNTLLKTELITRKDILNYVTAGFLAGLHRDENIEDSLLSSALKGRDLSMLLALLTFETYSPSQLKEALVAADITDRNMTSALFYIYGMISDKSFRTSVEMLRFKITDIQICDKYPEIPLHRPPSESSNKIRLRVLSLDGGGIKGLLTIQLLAAIEQSCGGPLNKNFEWIGGTSTGGLLALKLAMGGTVKECLKLYFTLKDVIFSGTQPYSAKILEKFLQEEFTSYLKMEDIKGVRVVITTSTGTVKNYRLKLFTNYDADTRKTPIWIVARMTSAAPTYFNSFDLNGVTYMDGGLTANNPTEALVGAIINATQDKDCLQNGISVSLGTGKFMDNSKPCGFHIRRHNFVSFVIQIVRHKDAFLNEITKADGEIVEQTRTRCMQSDTFYYRLTPTLPKEIRLDEIDNDVLFEAIWHTKTFVCAASDIIKEITQRLTSRDADSNHRVSVRF